MMTPQDLSSIARPKLLMNAAKHEAIKRRFAGHIVGVPLENAMNVEAEHEQARLDGSPEYRPTEHIETLADLIEIACLFEGGNN